MQRDQWETFPFCICVSTTWVTKWKTEQVSYCKSKRPLNLAALGTKALGKKMKQIPRCKFKKGWEGFPLEIPWKHSDGHTLTGQVFRYPFRHPLAFWTEVIFYVIDSTRCRKPHLTSVILKKPVWDDLYELCDMVHYIYWCKAGWRHAFMLFMPIFFTVLSEWYNKGWDIFSIRVFPIASVGIHIGSFS